MKNIITAKQNLTIAISSRALFNLDASHKVFKKDGIDAYAQYQKTHEKLTLEPGIGFSLVNKLLKLNNDKILIDVVLLSRNSAETGLRVFNSIEEYKLNISKAAFTGGNTPIPYITSLKADLFLSAHKKDVQNALTQGFAAASIVKPNIEQKCDTHIKQKLDTQLRIAFDGDAVLFSNASEQVYQKEGLAAFQENEKKYANIPLGAGPFKKFLLSLQAIQSTFPSEKNNPIRTALITARSAPSHKRVVNTMRKWKIRIDEMFFLGDLDKGTFLKQFKADIFFDDQKQNCQSASQHVPTGHVPQGAINN